MKAHRSEVAGRRWGVYFAVATFFLSLGVLLSARAQDQKVGVLRATTRTVNVNVVVTDAQGEPVKDLRKDDFTLLDGGEPQEITFFSSIDNEKTEDTPKAAPDVYTNTPSATRSVTILLFDTLNSRWTSQGYGLHHIRNFLRHIEPQDHVGIYVLGDDLKIAHDFKRDSSDLVAAMNRHDEEHSQSGAKPTAAEKESTGDPSLDRFLSGKDNRYRFELSGKASSAYNRDKLAFASQMTTASLVAIGRELAAVPGRKTLIWVTDSVGAMGHFLDDNPDEYLRRWYGKAGLNVPSVPYWENGVHVEQMVRLMNRAGIAVYTVDARGLETENLEFQGRPNAAPEVEDVIAGTPQPNQMLLEIANRTGGRAFFNRNDLETGLRRAITDARFTYALAYAPNHNTWKGEWRKIKVTVDRPDVAVLARSGYFALPDPRPIRVKDRAQFLSEVAASPIESAEIPLEVHIATAPNAAAVSVDATVSLNAAALASLLSVQNDGRSTGHFEVVFMQLGEKNRLLDATQKQIDANLKPEEYAKRSKSGWQMVVPLPVKPAAELLCVILHDEATDAVGSVRIPLTQYLSAAMH